MGPVLPKAVESVVVKRIGGTSFRMGFAEMNGWRPSMEDAHVIFMRSGWGFFGVLDGHGGGACSAFVARRLNEELAVLPDHPPKDEALKELFLRVDAEFLDTGQTSGSTGTFAIVTLPAKDEEHYSVRVGNIGDSRILLGRREGTMFMGGGTDGALTTDHKPNFPSERERIVRTGGRVESGMGGVARVNGELAVSRAFGDSQFKETGGPRPEDRPVTADPEFTSVTCKPTDFIMLVCDGISEGDFPNREVVRFAADKLCTGDGVDPGSAAAAVCKRALEAGSRDNLSCMIVLLGGGELPGASCELLPGPADSIGNNNFRNAYVAMAGHAGLSLPQAIERRYDALQQMLKEKGRGGHQALAGEMKKFGPGPPEDLEPGSEARAAWFERWASTVQQDGESPGGEEAGAGAGGMPQAVWRLLQGAGRGGAPRR